MVLIEDIKNYLKEFEKDILQLLSIFEKQYGFRNVVKLHWSGKIPKTNYLENGVEFYVHGGGCTAELDGKDISFDMDGNDNFSYEPFKFIIYLESLKLNIDGLDYEEMIKIFYYLKKEGFLDDKYRLTEKNR